MTTYSVEPDGFDDATLWRAKDEHDQEPKALSVVGHHTGDTLTYPGDHGVVFRAAAAVLAPSDALILAMAQAMFAESGGGSWHALSLAQRDHWIGSAYAALRILRIHAEEATS